MGCSVIRYQPKAEPVREEDRINKSVYIDEFKIVRTANEKKLKIRKNYGSDVALSLQNFLKANELFAKVETNRDSADLHIKGFIKNITHQRHQHIGKKYWTTSLITLLPAYGGSIWAYFINENTIKTGKPNNVLKITALSLAGISLFTSAYYQTKWHNHAEFIHNYDATIEIYDRDGLLLNTFSTDYDISVRLKDTREILQDKINISFESAFSKLSEAIISEKETIDISNK